MCVSFKHGNEESILDRIKIFINFQVFKKIKDNVRNKVIIQVLCFFFCFSLNFVA